MDSFYGHFVCKNFLTVEWYMCSYRGHKLKKNYYSLVWIRMSCIAFFVCVRVLGCVIVPVRIFKTSHYPRYPLPFEFRMHYETFHIQNTLYFDIFRFWTVPWRGNKEHSRHCPSVFFCLATLRSSALVPNMAQVSTVVTFLCKEIKTFVKTMVVTTTWPFKIPQSVRLNNSCVLYNEIRMDYHFIKRESLLSLCGHVIFPFH